MVYLKAEEFLWYCRDPWLQLLLKQDQSKNPSSRPFPCSFSALWNKFFSVVLLCLWRKLCFNAWVHFRWALLLYPGIVLFGLNLLLPGPSLVLYYAAEQSNGPVFHFGTVLIIGHFRRVKSSVWAPCVVANGIIHSICRCLQDWS